MLFSCFIPNKYIATLTLSEKMYTFEFIGELHMAALHSKKVIDDPSWDKNKLAEQIINEFSRVIKERNPIIFELNFIEPDIIQTKFTYSSPYNHPEATGLFHFKKDGKRLEVNSRYINEEEYEFLQKINIPSQGSLCIKTFGKIIHNNAHEPSNILQQCSTWRMKKLDESIKMVIDFSNEFSK